ncbi:nuclear transport factor 2 family protein [Mechercharimyces sp. CAU 1602]|uniref:nuclear transport factor 2 family protein n=1 Tax=Mechercharimyces sp. CAU 1602 TaxID=2973933 RepID=UPI002163B958|nr:nuclear transport factor 2 family protein [Mechercharimyces sp. CAU 1602]MCS1351006.1 nuclear transport factor 2 family protein [Mechercharimyces sp. CAU 1602]
MTSESRVLTQKQIAESFSNGDFEPSFPCLAKTIEWNIVGDKTIEGKEAVIEECKQTSDYFKTITTNFTTLNVISEKNRVAVNGTAEFIRDGQRLSFVSACDVYTFNDKHELQRIDSYCIK